MQCEPRRHHYIPQFIIKNWENSDEKVCHHTKTNSKCRLANPRSVFYAKDLYRDAVKNSDNPVELENSLAKFECEMAPVIEKLNSCEKSCKLKDTEYFKLKLFLLCMAFRSEQAFEIAREEQKQYSQEPKNYHNGNSLEEQFKINLNELATCASLECIENNSKIDSTFKFFIKSQIDNFHIALAQSASPNDSFILSSAYPASWNNKQLEDAAILRGCPLKYCGPHIRFYPISPKRTLMLVHNIVRELPRKVIPIRKETLCGALKRPGDGWEVPVNSACGIDVRYINDLSKEFAQYGWVTRQ